MTIPDYQTLMLPVLRLASDGEEHRFRDAVDTLANEFQLTEEERKELLPSGTQALFTNRVGWARSYLKQADLLSSPKRGYFQITPAGRQLLDSGIDRVDNSVLQNYPSFQEFRKRRKNTEGSDDSESGSTEETTQTPEDQIAAAYKIIRGNIEKEILDNIMGSSPSFFEQLVIDLLVKMGYGGSKADAGKAIGRSGDGGIDGIIKEDKLGLDVIFVQAKRWEGNVSRPEIQKFAGALQGQRAKKGIFITTSSFTKEASEFASSIDTKIILIDGERLANLMFDHSVGVSSYGSYELKRIDTDYFEEN
jgi:restriction system protein